ncbi:MAG: transposase, partial [Caldimicrobium sp.]
IVRKTVGYFRYETKKEIELLNQIYLYLRLYTNFFQPVRKCIMRIRIGSKIIKKYDVAKTPYQRVIECAEIEEKNKRYLKEIYKRLNPVELRRKIMDLQEKLFDQVRRKKIYEKRKLGKEEIFV